MAECCIEDNIKSEMKIEELKKTNSNQQSPSKSKTKASSPVLQSVGNGSYQRVLLAPKVEIKSEEQDSDLNLHFASCCLQNALLLVNNCLKSANNIPLPSKLNLLKSSILLKQSYVYLCFNEPILALTAALEMLQMKKKLPSGYNLLGRLYAGEALILLDRISEAIVMFDPKIVQEISFVEQGKETIWFCFICYVIIFCQLIR